MCFLLIYLSIALILYEATNNLKYNLNAISKVQHGTEITHDLTKITFGSLQLLFDDNQDLRYTRDEMYTFAKSYNIMDQYNGFKYGDQEGGYFNLVGMSSEIDQKLVIANKSCGNFSFNNFAVEQIYCMSLDQLIDANVYLLTRQTEDVFNRKYPDAELLDQFWKNYMVYIQTRTLSWDLMLLSINYFTTVIRERMISGLACVLPAAVLIILIFAQRYYGQIKKERAIFMLMFNMVPCDVLDNIDPLRNFIMNRNFQKKKSSKDDGRNEVKAICDAAVDGVILCTNMAVIEIFNPSSETMFGYKATDVIGSSLLILFDKESKDKLETALVRLRNSTENTGETFELVCVRKNERKFFARVSISISILQSSKDKSSSTSKRSIISCFIKDITTEIKHNNLINQEKMKSEALLLNILPEPVANRLKAGETNIYENFKVGSCHLLTFY